MPEIKPSELVPCGIRKQKSSPVMRLDFSFSGAPGEGETMFTDSFSTLSVFDKAATVAFYLTLAVVVIAFVLGFFVRKFRQDSMSSYLKTSFAAIVGYAVGITAILLFLKLDEYIADGYIDYATFIPVAVMVVSALILAVAYYVVSVFNKDKSRLTAIISAAILGAELLAVLIAQTVIYYRNNDSVEVSGEVQLYIYTLLLIAVIVALALVFGKKQTDINKTKSVSYAAICAALSFALSYVRFIELPQGGSVTLASLLPLMIYSYMFGIRRGVVLGAVYGLLQFIQAPWFYHPVQFLLDYPIAFAAIGLAGIFREKKLFDNKKPVQFALGALLVVILRYFSHVVSGIFVFGSGDPDNYSAVAWSFLYNSFAFADMAISMVAGCALFASRNFVKLLDVSRNS